MAVEASCAKGDVCVWSGKAYQGTRCHWRGNDPDWRGGAVRCGIKVRSIWNNGRTNDPYNKVRFYRQKDYQSQISDPVPVTAKPITAAWPHDPFAPLDQVGGRRGARQAGAISRSR